MKRGKQYAGERFGRRTKVECSVCHMTFATRTEYEKHMREKHNR